MKHIYLAYIPGTHKAAYFTNKKDIPGIKRQSRRDGHAIAFRKMERWLYSSAGGSWDLPTFMIMSDELAA
jgi:hypothetical protein